MSGHLPIRKKLVTDEQYRPVAVQIDYEDWLEIERLLGLSRAASDDASESTSEPPSLQHLADRARPHWQGGDGLDYQRRLRAEWTRLWDPEAEEGA